MQLLPQQFVLIIELCDQSCTQLLLIDVLEGSFSLQQFFEYSYDNHSLRDLSRVLQLLTNEVEELLDFNA